jgi:hypothetical protein
MRTVTQHTKAADKHLTAPYRQDPLPPLRVSRAEIARAAQTFLTPHAVEPLSKVELNVSRAVSTLSISVVPRSWLARCQFWSSRTFG